MSDTKIVDAIAQLKDKSFSIRRSDMTALAEIADPSAVVKIIALLMEDDWKVRSRAAEALGEIGHPSAVPMLVEMLKDQTQSSIDSTMHHLYDCAAKALGKIGTAPAIFALRDMMKAEDLTVRCRAASALLEAGEESAVPALIGMLNAGDVSVRLHVIRVLGEGGDVSAVPALLAMLNVPTVPVPIQVAAAEALMAIGDSETLPRKILASPKLTVNQRLELFDTLRHIRFQGDMPLSPMTLRYSIADTHTLCETVLNEDDEQARSGAQAVLNWLDGDRDLLHAANRPTANDPQILLRAAQGSGPETRPDTLLIGSEAPEQEAAPSPAPRSLWNRMFGNQKKPPSE